MMKIPMKPKGIFFSLGSLLLFLLIVSIQVDAAVYNTTNLTNADNIYEQAKALNIITEGWIGYGILLIIFFVTFVPVSTYSNVIGALSAACWSTAVAATILLPLQLISFYYYQFILLFLGVMGFVSFIANR